VAEVAWVILHDVSVQVLHMIQEHTRNPSGETGADFKLTAQSINVCVPLIAKTMVFISSIGTDLITIAFVPRRQSDSTWVSFSCPVGFV